MLDTSRKDPYETQGGPPPISTGDVPEDSVVLHLRRQREGPDGDAAVIAVMGPTGSGKSTFINLVSGSALKIDRGLESCTATVQHGCDVDIDGHRVVLVDTPGFDDTSRSDIDVLNTIAAYLETSYRSGAKLAGIIYFHRISDVKMSGAPVKNFRMFRELCGESTLKNVVIVTNMWEGIDRQVGKEREEELKTKPIFFEPAISKGARMARHENTVDSAKKILRLVLCNRPLPLRIQEELVDENKDIMETGAGEEMNRELESQVRKHKDEMDALKEQIERAIKDKDEETRRELEEEKKRVRDEVERLKDDAKRWASDYQRERQELEYRFGKMEEKMERIDRLGIEATADAAKEDSEDSEEEKKKKEKKEKRKRKRWSIMGAVGEAVTAIVSVVVGINGFFVG